MPRAVYVVPHCHWDREWYQPHELFRWRLVQMIDELLDHMEQHPEYTCFNLDGQTIVIEDYLELRPENESRLRRLIETGRIVIGPWLVQPDEFLPSGESHIRSFQRGIRYAERLGGSLKVGHCADQFGHIAQMPQIMAGLGLTSACLWRGVPDAIPGWSFQWEAPDGTRLPVLYLRNSYSSGWRLPQDPEELIERVQRQEPGRRDEEPLLLMNGTDHSRMEKHVPGVLDAAGGRGYDFRMATLADYERAQLAAGIDDVVHRGELRSPDRSNVLVGVLSARINLKQRDFEVGSFLERVAEPLELLSWLHGGGDGSPALKQAWRLMLENSPHDSICGCSVDQVHREMLARYDRAEQLARQVARESLWHLAREMEVPEPGALVVFRTVQGMPQVLECEVPAWFLERDVLVGPGGEQAPFEPVLEVGGGEILQHDQVSLRGALRHLDFLREQRYDLHNIERMDWRIEDRHLRVETTVGQAANLVDEEAVRREVRAAVRAGEADSAEVIVRKAQTTRLEAVLPPAPAIGVESYLAAEASKGSRRRKQPAPYAMRARRRGLAIRDRESGMKIGPIEIVSEGDRGDEYNFDPVGKVVRARFDPGETLVEKAGTRTSYLMTGGLAAPWGLSETRAGRSRARLRGAVLLDATAWVGIPWLQFEVTVHNRSQDHRLRALIPLPFEVDEVFTENQFHVARRSLEPQPYNGTGAEQPPTTFPQKTFAAFERDGRGFAVFNRGLPEGEVVRDKNGRQFYALTLLRCVGWLSRNDLVSRRGGAGPMTPTPDAQMLGVHTFEFAIACYQGDWQMANVQAMAHAYAYPPYALATNGHAGNLGASVPLVTFPEGMTPSAMHRSERDGAPIVRGYNASERAIDGGRLVVPAGSAGAARVNLLEEHLEELPRAGDDGWPLGLRPWEIASVRFGRREG